MMRLLQVTLTDLFCCRMKRRSTFFIILFIFLFAMGNYFLMKRMDRNNSDKNNVGKYFKDRQVTHGIDDDANKNDFDVDKRDFVRSINIDSNDGGDFREIVITKYEKEKEKKVFENSEKIKTNQEFDNNKNHNEIDSKSKSNSKKMALLVLACNRVEVKRCLDKIFQYLPKDGSMPVIVSQDCGHQQTASVIRSYGDKLELIQQPDLGPISGVHINQFVGYYKISRHYRWALKQVFQRKDIDSVIIVEDDIDISPDFFEYFIASRKLMDTDKSIYCVSAWNDNGKENSIDPSAFDLLYRSDFFPGLGWLLTRKIWDEIGEKWPKGFWDDWMRDPKQRKDRVCIRPEISRTKTFGRVGVSNGQFYDEYLKYIKLNTQGFPFLDYDLSYLTKTEYDRTFLETVYSVNEGNPEDISKNDNDITAIRITYRSNGQFTNLARSFGIMTDLKAGVPRTAYKGVVTFYRNNKRIYIAPPETWKGYTEH